MTLFDTVTEKRSPNIEGLMKKMTEGIGEGWTEMLKGADGILYDIARQLYERIPTEVICPESIRVFRAFKECKFSNLRVVWVLQDPYHQVINGSTRVADGIAMSCSNTGNLQPTLRLVYDEIGRTTGDTDRNPDLRKWANQGILMLNTALTVAQAKPGSHTDIWRPFTQYLLRRLGDHKDLIWIFSGANAKSYANLVKQGTKYYTVHPAAAAYTGGHWRSEDLFNNVNYSLVTRGQDKIVW